MTSRILSSFVTACLALSACSVEVHDGSDGYYDTWNDDCDSFDGDCDGGAVCTDYCRDLMECGAIGARDYGDCFDQCSVAFDRDATGTRRACACVAQERCQSSLSVIIQCGAPNPTDGGSGGTGAGGAGGSVTHSGGASGAPADSGGASAAGGSTTTGSAGSAGEPSPDGCTTPHDCAAGEDCVEGTCQVRCYGSCDCPTGESCVSGYCAFPSQPVPSACEDDCDCPSGEECADGLCTAT